MKLWDWSLEDIILLDAFVLPGSEASRGCGGSKRGGNDRDSGGDRALEMEMVEMEDERVACVVERIVATTVTSIHHERTRVIGMHLMFVVCIGMMIIDVTSHTAILAEIHIG